MSSLRPILDMNTLNKSILFMTLAASTAWAGVDVSKLPAASTRKGLTYSADIRPLFEASCFRCHGSDRAKAGVRLDSLEGVLRGGKEGKVVVPGKAESSRLLLAVSQLDPEFAMPPTPKPGHGGGRPGGPGGPPGGPGMGGPGASGPGMGGPGPGGFGPPPKPLTAEQVGLVRAWIAQGAK